MLAVDINPTILRWSLHDDRRVNRLFLTQDFAPLAEPTREISQALEDELLQGIAPAERQAFLQVMRALHRKLSAGDRSGADDPIEEAG